MDAIAVRVSLRPDIGRLSHNGQPELPVPERASEVSAVIKKMDQFSDGGLGSFSHAGPKPLTARRPLEPLQPARDVAHPTGRLRAEMPDPAAGVTLLRIRLCGASGCSHLVGLVVE
jgi:hypothetical protein